MMEKLMIKQPNIILLVMDSARTANMSCYGYHRTTTPKIDALAKEGTLFERAISVGSWTLPVHASLFTGLYPLNHGLTVSKDALPDNFPTLAHQLKVLGYQTASFSNNAYVSEVTGLTQGFEVVEELWRASNPRGTKRTKMSRLIKQLEHFGRPTKPLIRLLRAFQVMRSAMKRQRNKRDKGAQLTNEKIRTWLTEARDPDTPFFIFVNYMESHEPYYPPHPYNRRFMPNRFTSRRIERVGNNKEAILSGSEKRRRDDLEILAALYDGELNYLDDQIGQLVHFIESLGILNETVLVITSDHGDSLGEHNHLGHRMTLYEPLVHVPLIVRYPARFQPGTRVAQQVSLIDLYPTFLAVAGANLSHVPLNGFHSLTMPPGSGERPFLIAENTAPKSLNGVVSRMLRAERYKYIWKSNQRHELYDLVKDPNELNNLVEVEQQVARNMHEQLAAWQRSLENHRIEPSQAEYDESVVERLRALGYVE
jgi:arylsulfatase A-like enzyme